MTDHTIEVVLEGIGFWSCPGCGESNKDDNTLTCAHCNKHWQTCPNEYCYGDGPDCPICHGCCGGLVEVSDVS